MPLWVAGGAIIGNYLLGQSSERGQSSANRTNIQLGREQMRFQERMSNSAHQREVEDLKKAGLNPILSAGGSGSSTPPGAMPRVESTKSEKNQIMRDAAMQVAQIKNLNANTAKTVMDTEVSEANWQLIGQQVLKSVEETLNTRAIKEQNQEILKGLRVEGDIDSSKYGKAIRYINRLLPGMTTGLGVLKGIK